MQDDEAERSATPFRSFWQVGYEGSDHINSLGVPVDMVSQTGHLTRLDEDYRNLAPLGIRTVRESAGWRTVAAGGGLDFSSVRHRAMVAREHGIQILWTAMHYGLPPEVDPFGDAFADQFADYCGHLARVLEPFRDDLAPVFTPINEISFHCWAICNTRLFHPFRGDTPDRADTLKRNLVRAALAGVDAIRAVIPDARMLHVDPLVHIVAPAGEPGLEHAARAERAHQFDAWDMLCGRLHPHLGGSPAHLDLVGVNYYPPNQWEYGTNNRLHWHLKDPRRQPFGELLAAAGARYGRPLVISETSHLGSGKAPWLAKIAAQVALTRAGGAAVEGVCLYPAVDRPDWEDARRWHDSGLWRVTPGDPSRARVIDAAYRTALVQAQSTLPAPVPAPPLCQEEPMETLIVFSHLRWDFVYQRPQQLLTRLAGTRRILFVEEPLHADVAEPVAEVQQPHPAIQVLRIHTPSTAPGFDDAQAGHIQQLVGEHLQSEGITEYSVWLYTPMALPLLMGLSPRAIIFDCMDDLAGFAGAPPQVESRTRTLLDIANVVFTGGPGLQQKHAHAHPNIHCVPSSVDAAHFAKGAQRDLAHEDLAQLPRPRLGFFGVIDERLDTDLIAALARRHPDWQLCMVGPVVKIDPAQLPRAANIHYFGQQPYSALPSFLAGWDVSLLPFARNDATRYISPTKTLEYMAAGQPVVSTRIADVVTLYGAAVRIADDHDGFIRHCEELLDENETQRQQRLDTMQHLVTATSWDVAARRIGQLLDEAERAGLSPVAVDYLRTQHVARLPVGQRRAQPPRSSTPCLILGAGPTGLSAALHLGAESCVVERNSVVGGWCRSVEEGGFVFDHAGHIMFSNDAYVLSMYEVLLGDNIHWQNREAWIYSKGVHTRYPFQGALYGLPADVLKECLVGAIEARLALADANGAPSDAAQTQRDPPARAVDCCADGAALVDDTAIAAHHPRPSDDFETFIHRTWGAGVAKHFALPYNRKLWTIPLDQMETSWLGGRVPLPDLGEMVNGALQPSAPPMGPNARFGYPLRGGFQALMNGFLPLLEGDLLLDSEVVRVSLRDKVAHLACGRQIGWRHLVSTMPLPRLVEAIGSEAPAHIHEAAQALRYVSIRCVNLGVARAQISNKHWIYYPEDTTLFHRVFLQGNASPHCNPPGGFGLTCEISHSPGKPLPLQGKALIRRCIDDCIAVGLLREDDVIAVANQVDMPCAYVIYDHARMRNVALVRAWLLEHDVHLAGRYSEWEYYNSDHAFLAGRRVAQQVRALLGASRNDDGRASTARPLAP